MELDTRGYNASDYEALYALMRLLDQERVAKGIDQVMRGLRLDPPRLPTEASTAIAAWIKALEGAFEKAFLPAKAARLIKEESPLLVHLRVLQRRAQDREEGWPACRRCGCTEHSACPGGCYWVQADLCSACQLIEIERERVRLEQEKFEIEVRRPPGEPESMRVAEIDRRLAELAQWASEIRAVGERYKLLDEGM